MKATVRRTVIAGVAAAGLAALMAGGIASASVSSPVATDACATGVYFGYCGTQIDEGTPALSIAVSLQGLRPTGVIATSRPQPTAADWFWFRYDGGQNKIAEYAPNGVASNEVMAEVGGRIVLQTATGSLNQQWNYNGTGWTNEATGDIIQASFNGGPLLAVPGSTAPSPANTWDWHQAQ